MWAYCGIDLKVYEFFTQQHHPFDQQQRPFEQQQQTIYRIDKSTTININFSKK